MTESLTYICPCGNEHKLRITAHENPPIPYVTWPDDAWYIHDFDPGNFEVDVTKCCDAGLPVLRYNLSRPYRTETR